MSPSLYILCFKKYMLNTVYFIQLIQMFSSDCTPSSSSIFYFFKTQYYSIVPYRYTVDDCRAESTNNLFPYLKKKKRRQNLPDATILKLHMISWPQNQSFAGNCGGIPQRNTLHQERFALAPGFLAVSLLWSYNEFQISGFGVFQHFSYYNTRMMNFCFLDAEGVMWN